MCLSSQSIQCYILFASQKMYSYVLNPCCLRCRMLSTKAPSGSWWKGFCLARNSDDTEVGRKIQHMHTHTCRHTQRYTDSQRHTVSVYIRLFRIRTTFDIPRLVTKIMKKLSLKIHRHAQTHRTHTQTQAPDIHRILLGHSLSPIDMIRFTFYLSVCVFVCLRLCPSTQWNQSKRS